jgi:hypothetical protein
LATSASEFNPRTLLYAIEQLRSALDESKAWQQAWQPVIDRLQAQQRDSDLVLRDILSELRRLQSSRATQGPHALLSQTVAWQHHFVRYSFPWLQDEEGGSSISSDCGSKRLKLHADIIYYVKKNHNQAVLAAGVDLNPRNELDN